MTEVTMKFYNMKEKQPHEDCKVAIRGVNGNFEVGFYTFNTKEFSYWKLGRQKTAIKFSPDEGDWAYMPGQEPKPLVYGVGLTLSGDFAITKYGLGIFYTFNPSKFNKPQELTQSIADLLNAHHKD